MRKFILALLITWLAAGSLSLAWRLNEKKQEREAMAFQVARTFLNQLLQVRSWNAGHGGVYVPVGPDAQPNPFLEDPDRDVTTVSGLQLTKINPAFMTRQLAEIAVKESGARFHITSLSPIRPGNRAEDWEREWLTDFQAGVRERGAFITTREGEQFRYMAPLFVEKECLQCHAEQGYKLNDHRGGISVVLPLDAPLFNRGILISHLLAMISGSLLILFFGNKLIKSSQVLVAMNAGLQNEMHGREKAQLELLETHAKLEERVQERTAELKRSNQALQEFAHIISHDLQEPLMLIQAFSTRIRKKSKSTLSDQCSLYLDQIDTSAGRMQQLIDGLLQYSQARSKKRLFEQVDLNQVVQDVLDDLSIPIKNTHADISIDYLPTIEADQLQMRQLFQNLISNSLKYSNPDKEAKIYINTNIVDKNYTNADRLQIIIQDNGIGFDPLFNERIFNIFEQIPAKGTRKGTGIGLSICKTIVEHHNGSIVANGIPGEGARFVVELPLNQGE